MKAARKKRTASSRTNTRRGMRIFRFASVVLLVSAMAVGVYYLGQSSVFDLDDVEFYGNRQLSERKLMGLMQLDDKRKIWQVPLREMAERLSYSPWIKDVSLRKEYPGRLEVRIREAVPTALLKKEGVLYLVDREGEVLERLGGESMPFLPVIVGDPKNDRGAFTEAVSLAKVVRETGLSSKKERVEITGFEKGANELTLNIDGLLVRIGEGEYGEKLGRFFSLAEEIRKRNIEVDYVDLRFANRVVVKAVAGVLR